MLSFNTDTQATKIESALNALHREAEMVNENFQFTVTKYNSELFIFTTRDVRYLDIIAQMTGYSDYSVEEFRTDLMKTDGSFEFCFNKEEIPEYLALAKQL